MAIRVQAEQYRAICEALQELDPRDISVKDSSGTELFIEWVESNENVGKYAVTSPIDKLLLEVYPLPHGFYSQYRTNSNMVSPWNGRSRPSSRSSLSPVLVSVFHTSTISTKDASHPKKSLKSSGF